MNKMKVLATIFFVCFLVFLSGCGENVGTVKDDKDDELNTNDEDNGLSYDTDEDGINNENDAFPQDKTQWADRDGDGYGDNPNGINPDAFPDDPYEWKDSDLDGVGDNIDIYDSGNGGIKVKIDEFHCDESPYDEVFSNTPDPYFIVEIYVWDISLDDWFLSKSETSSVFTDKIDIYNFEPIMVDVDEDISSVYVNIEVWDKDLDSDDIIDIGQYQEYFNPKTEFSHTFSYDGREDLKDELDGWITYTVSVIGI